MSDVTDAIEESFVELLKTKPYKSISVKEICAHAHVSRNAFYAHFRDKRAIVTKLFRQHALNPFIQAIDLLSPEVAYQMSNVVFARFYQGIYDNREYYENLVAPMCGVDPTFELVVARSLYAPFMKLLKKRGFSGPEYEAEMLAHHFAASQGVFLEKWISDKCEVPVSEVARIYSLIISGCWEKIFDLK